MNSLKYIVILLLFSSNQIYSQIEFSNRKNNVLENKKISDDIKLKELQKLTFQYKKAPNKLENGILLTEIGFIYYTNEEIEKAISFSKKGIDIIKIYKPTHLKDLNIARFKLANIYKDFDSKKYYSILEEIVADNEKDNLTINAIALLTKKGDYYTGINKLNSLLLQKNTIDKELYIRKTIIKIYAYMHESIYNSKLTSDLKLIKENHRIIDEKFPKSSFDDSFIYGIYNNLANIYESFNEYDIALDLYIKAKKYFKANNEKSNMLYVTNNIGYLYAKQNKINQAIECFQEILKTSEDDYQLATAYNNLGYFLNSIPSKKKITYFQKAIQTILGKSKIIYNTPSLETIRESGYQQDILVFLIDLSNHYVKAYKESNDINYLIKAKETLYRIDELVSLIRYESNTEQSKLFWIEKGVNTYMLAVEVCYLLNKPDEAFYFMEKNKALLLQENIKKFQAKLEMDIPKNIQEREYKLYFDLKKARKEFQLKPKDALLKLTLNKRNLEFQNFMDSLRVKYPNYVKIKQEIETVSVQKVISNLTLNECFITYILNENDGYGIFCNQKEKIFFKIENVTSFQQDINSLKHLMKQRILNKQQTNNFQKASNSIFKRLFPFDNALAKINNKKIIIVPDDSLLNLPFEALSINDSSNLSKSYLINFTEISYLQSFSILDKIKQIRHKASKKILAIAPYQFQDAQLQDLIRSKEAVKSLNKYYSTDILIGDSAIKKTFYEKSRDYEIIHLNTHAGFDSISESPWISFRKEKLTLDELYGIDNQAELVILDACKTNEGTIASGEGMLSLSRGFFNNGSKSVLASLWNVNEKAGNDIIATFYNELEQGKTKSKALQLAKINYLKEHQFSEILPYYWASFTLTGSTDSIKLTKNYLQGIPLLIIIASIILLIGFVYLKRKSLFK
jgi:CHAT domain-containing protein